MFYYRFPFIISVVCLIAGCGPAVVKTFPCKGVAKWKGTPCDGALVVFHPLAADRINDPKPVATTDAMGNFSLTTFELNDGAIEGDYGVTIVWNVPDKEAKFSLSGEGGGGTDKLQGRYGDPSNPKLKATVTARDDNVFTFDLE